MLETWLQNKEKFDLKSSGSLSGSDFLATQSLSYLSGLLKVLDSKIDKRLTRTFRCLFMVILLHRNPKMGLLLSELGGYICGHDHAPAGTKRISNLIRSRNWESDVVDEFLLAKTEARLSSFQASGKLALLIWDESKIEKPESLASEGLCSVESSKGKRLIRIKEGFYEPPCRRICVPGFHWTAVLLTALGEVPSLCQMSWWTSRGEHQKKSSEVFTSMFEKIGKNLPSHCVHVMDRGYANAPTIGKILTADQHFLIRWIKNRRLVHHSKGEKQTHLLSRSFRAMDFHKVYDAVRKKYRTISVAFAPVHHPDFPDPQLYLIIVRDKERHHSPMYLLTSVPVKNTDTAWEMFYSYMQRWNIEQAFRCNKAELGMEAPRLWSWKNRLKLLAIVALVFDFLLSLIRNWCTWIHKFLRNYCHRTGKRHREATVPIYRLRCAIANCLCRPVWFTNQNVESLQNSG